LIIPDLLNIPFLDFFVWEYLIRMKIFLDPKFISLAIACISLSEYKATYAEERTPTCSANDVMDIRNVASHIAKETLTGNGCRIFINNKNGKQKFLEYVYSTPSTPYYCRLAKTALIITSEELTIPSIPLLKCLKGDPSTDRDKWDTYYKEYDDYVVRTNKVYSKWKTLPKKPLYPMPADIKMDRYKAAIYTTYPYQNQTKGTLPPGVEVWFTRVEELVDACKKIPNRANLSKEQLSYRFSELLGLPPDSPSDTPHSFAFMTVPSALVSGEIDYKSDSKIFNGFKGPGIFRPCASVSINITDNICKKIDALPLDENVLKKDLVKDDKVPTNELLEDNLSKWSAYQFYKRYDNHDGWPHYPWTGRGYTYDWGEESVTRDHYGLSEYVIEQNTEYVVYNTQTLEEFAKTCRDQ
jgi:hypothetical protein